MLWIVWICDDYMPQGFFSSELKAEEYVEYACQRYGTQREVYFIESTQMDKEYTS